MAGKRDTLECLVSWGKKGLEIQRFFFMALTYRSYEVTKFEEKKKMETKKCSIGNHLSSKKTTMVSKKMSPRGGANIYYLLFGFF